MSNIHIKSFVTRRAIPVQEELVSRSLNLYIENSDDGLVVWDIEKGVKQLQDPESNSIRIETLSPKSVSELKQEITGLFGLVPFNKLSDLPRNATWHPVSEISDKTPLATSDVYDIEWVDQKNMTIHRRWRLFLDPKSKLPLRTEYYLKRDKAEYQLMSFKIIEHITDDKINAYLQEAGLKP